MLQLSKWISRKKAQFPVAVLAVTVGAAGWAYSVPAHSAVPSAIQKAEAGLGQLPIFFTMPERSYAELSPEAAKLTIDLKHPATRQYAEPTGLRIIRTKRAQAATHLAKAGLLQTGDILLTYRPKEWAMSGPYPNVQLGVSHAGVVLIGENGQVYNIDNPMDQDHVGQGQLNSKHYQETEFLHVVRPRNLTAEQKRNLKKWIKLAFNRRAQIYPSQLSFNKDYSAPSYAPGTADPTHHVRKLGNILLGDKTDKTSMFCSELAWSLLSLRDCDPEKDKEAFKGPGSPSCVSPIFPPMKALGDFLVTGSPASEAGLADGPSIVIDSLRMPPAERAAQLKQVFSDGGQKMSKISSGHRAVAEMMKCRFKMLEGYFNGTGTHALVDKLVADPNGAIPVPKADLAGNPAVEMARMECVDTGQMIPAAHLFHGTNQKTALNYSPTAFVINSMLPVDNKTRAFDYVGTIKLE